MKLYEIDQAILDCVDPETGDVIDLEQLEALSLERDRKIEGIALWIKDLKAESEALYKEEKNLMARRTANDNKVESLKTFLRIYLNGEKFKTTKTAVSYRNTKAIEIEDEELFTEWAEANAPDLLKVTVDISKTAIKDALEAGQEVRYATQIEKQSIIIR